MARHLFLAGVDRWKDVERGTLEIQKALTYKIDTCSFNIAGEKPGEGEEVIIEDTDMGFRITEGVQPSFSSISGIPVFEPGAFGQGLRVNVYTYDEELSIPTAGVLNPSEGTIDIKIKPEIVQNYNTFFLMSISTGRFLLFFDSNGTIKWDFGTANDSISSPSGAVTASEWVRVTMRWSAAKGIRELFVDGYSVGSKTFIPPASFPSSVFVVNNYAAVIDDLRIDNTWREIIIPDYAWCWPQPTHPVKYELAGNPLPVDELTVFKMDFENDLKAYKGEWERLFAGIVVRVDLVRTMYPDKRVKIWRVECDDYTALLDRKLVVETYENMPADVIFRSIAARYCPGFTVSGVQSGAPIVETTGNDFEYKRPSECFRWLCDYVGWQWQPDYFKDLQFFNAEDLATPAPMTLTPGGKFRFNKHTVDTQGLRNRVYVRGGKMLSEFQTVQWRADGVARQWVLPWGPHEISFNGEAARIGVGEIPNTVGVEYLHDESEYDFMLSYSEKYIRCSAQTPTPAQGVTISFDAKQDIDVIALVDDYESQAAIAAIQGGDGIYEHVITDDSLTTLDAAEVVGKAFLREHANPKVTGSFETYVDGWQPGQLVEINLPNRGVVGTFLVQKVTLRPDNKPWWRYQIEYGGRLKGTADLLKAMVSAQQKKPTGEAVIIKIVREVDKVEFADLFLTAKRTPPFICGDYDARCGFVQVGGV
jgi:hypothetical protein